MNQQRILAKITDYSLVLMAIVARDFHLDLP
jgi:hypothetical protein